RRQERRGRAGQLEVGTHAVDGVTEDRRVVEREHDLPAHHVVDGNERGSGRVGARRGGPDVTDDGDVRDGDDVHPRIAHMPANGSTPRWTRSTCSRPFAIVNTTTSTVTAKAGNSDGS